MPSSSLGQQRVLLPGVQYIYDLNSFICHTIDQYVIWVRYDLVSTRNTSSAKQVWMLGGRQDGSLNQITHTACCGRIVVRNMEDDGCETIASRHTPKDWQHR